jgi:hypothetical protein
MWKGSNKKGGSKMKMVVALKVVGKEELNVTVEYIDTTRETVDLVSSELKKAVKKLFKRDLHKDLKPGAKEIVGAIVLPATKGDLNIVLSLIGTSADFSITYPKADMATVLRVEGALMKLMAELNKG